MTIALEGPGATEVARLVLYALEWLMGIIVWGLTLDNLMDVRGRGCYFGNSANCGAIVFFGITSTFVLTAVIAAHCLHYTLSTKGLRRKPEAFIFIGFAVMWGILGIVTAAGAPRDYKSSDGNGVAVFTWASSIASLASAGIAFYESKQGDDYGNNDLRI
eukprot:Plantae.Rhodophyta-Palmaria_palmata.ctg11102.p1 GENE.Plantae.Rhodophyta-Palmaria_palmata.ctg11102~~Plantae.Rhodophyta-Palmaria_palmata.ctg11102.p1  ORF type:complete len:160 (-),score=13.73 Plantae.Rhodophyta-Palmaria_palmata.ctg11102:312-791(-)